MMGTQNDRLRPENGIASLEHPDHIVSDPDGHVGSDGALKIDRLEVLAPLPAGFESDPRELCRDVLGGATLSVATGQAPFEGVVGKVADGRHRLLKLPGDPCGRRTLGGRLWHRRLLAGGRCRPRDPSKERDDSSRTHFPPA